MTLHASTLRPGAVVTIDGLLTVRAAFLSPERWNGWACPYLDRTATESLARQISAADPRDGMGTMALVGDRLSFAPFDDPENVEHDDGVMIDGARYWSPGAWSWVWSEWPEDDGHRITDTPEGVVVCERCGLPARDAYGDPCHADGRDRYTDRVEYGPVTPNGGLFAEDVQCGDVLSVPGPDGEDAVTATVCSTLAERYNPAGDGVVLGLRDALGRRWSLTTDPFEVWPIAGVRA